MLKILIFGDSIGYGKRDHEGGWVARLRKRVDETYNFGEQCSNAQVYNCCIPGETALRMQHRFVPEVEMRSVDRNDEVRVIVVFAVGINDSSLKPWIQGSQTPLVAFEQAMDIMIQYCINKDFDSLVVGLTPVDESKVGELLKNKTIQLYDATLQSLAKKQKVNFIPMFDHFLEQLLVDCMSDGLHPDDVGHAMIFQEVRRVLFL